jgi:hypothetical protein
MAKFFAPATRAGRDIMLDSAASTMAKSPSCVADLHCVGKKFLRLHRTHLGRLAAASIADQVSDLDH